jgi:VanZ family protein
MKRYLTLWLPVAFWASLIFYLSSIPYLRITEAWYDLILRKLAHVFIFGVLARLLARALSGSTFWSWKKTFYWTLIVSALYAGSDEYHQSFVAGRGASLVDVAIDSLGVWMALGLRP